MKRDMRIDFYRVELPESEDKSFEDIIRAIAKSPEDAGRNVLLSTNDPVRLQTATYVSKAKQWEGELVRIRMHELPMKASLSGEFSAFDLDDDEGIGEEVSFLYDTQLHVLALQANRNAVSASQFAYYFRDKGGLEELLMQPVILPDALKRMADMQEIRKFEVAIAGLNNDGLFANQGRALGSILDLRKEFQAPSVGFTVSMGRNKGTLTNVLDQVKKFVGIASQKPAEIKKIIVTGKVDQDQDSVAIDLLEYRMSEKVAVDLDEDRRLSFADRRRALQGAWKKHKTELDTMFGGSNGHE